MKTRFEIDTDAYNSYAFELCKDQLYNIDRSDCLVRFRDNTVTVLYEEGQEDDAQYVEDQISSVLSNAIGGAFDIMYNPIC